MATRMGAAGVRLELHDKSGYSLVETPYAIGGVVGFAPRGELNKIQLISNTAEQDTYFGIGFNNPRYNQGMYAARAVINSGGHVEYVRPYGEEIDKTKDDKRDLKTDAFVVAFDRNAVLNEENLSRNSLKIEHFASTRYKTDGAAKYGVTRKINNIAETIVNNSNTDFRIDADDFTNPKNWEGVGGAARGKSDMVLFAIMNADPSAAERAYISYKVDSSSAKATGDGDIKVIAASKVGFPVDSVVFAPAPVGQEKLCKFVVKNIVDKKVTLHAADDYTITALTSLGYKPTDIFYCDAENAVADGYDYLTVKTAVAGQGAKTLSGIQLNGAGLSKLKKTLSGTTLAFHLEDYESTAIVRVATSNGAKGTAGAVSDGKVTITLSNGVDPTSFVVVGDSLQIDWTEGSGADAVTKSTVGEVIEVTETTVKLNVSVTTITGTVTVTNGPKNWVDGVNVLTLHVSNESTVENVCNDLVELLRSKRIGYGKSVVLNDIVSVDSDNITIHMTPGACIDYVVGDLVAVTLASNDNLTGTASKTYSFPADEAILYTATVLKVNPISNEIVLGEAMASKTTAEINDKYTNDGIGKTYQLLNLTQTNKAVYGAVSSMVNPTQISGLKTAIGTEGSSTAEVEVIETGTTENTYKVTVAELVFEMASVPVTAEGAELNVGDDFTGVAVDDVSSQVTNVEGTVTAITKKVTTSGNTETITYIVKVAVGFSYRVVAQTAPTTIRVTNTMVGINDQCGDIYFVGNYTTAVPFDVQEYPNVAIPDTLVSDDTSDETPFVYFKYGESHVVERSEKVLVDNTIGATFVGLGLASIKYEDINYTGETVKVYDLTDEGEEVARLYLCVDYCFHGHVYEFDGTIVKYVLNSTKTQLFIGEQAKTELLGTGVKFILNDSDEINMFLTDSSYDLSGTVAGYEDDEGVIQPVPSSSTTAIAFNEKDPAIIHNSVWYYDPANNINPTTIANAYNLFLNKDKSDVSYFVGAGMGISNFGMRGYETLNTLVMEAVLNVCELRKDCFALFDGVADPRIDVTLKKDNPASRFGSTLGRWGAIYDFRPIFTDRIITMSDVEIAPSIAMAALITANRKGGIYWKVPSGEDTGMVPAAWCNELKYERVFTYPEDPNSDIARLSDIHVNAARMNKKGIYLWGDFTMQMEDTAFNQIHVTMLIAQVHKMFYNYLDAKVFKLNTPALRSQITTDIQLELDKITYEDPSGFDEAYVICDDTNNTKEVVKANRLYVDLMLIPTKSTRYIYLRTNVLADSNTGSKTVESTMTTGNR